MSSFSDRNCIVIQGWMITELKLSGNELIIYAIIYGATQDGKSEFADSLDYLVTASGASKKTVTRILDSLVKDKKILKLSEKYNVCTYKANLDVVKMTTDVVKMTTRF